MAEVADVKVYRKDLGYGQGHGGSNYYLVTETEAQNLAKWGYTRSEQEANVGRADPGGSIFIGTDTAANYGGASNLSTGATDDTNTSSGDAVSDAQYAAGMERAKALFKFLPEAIQSEFAKAWVKFGNVELAKSATRNTQPWKDEFGFLERDDGSLIMDEVEAMATKATYRQTLAEVGIADTSDFEEKFEQLIKGEVSGAEFQQRIDVTYNAVKNNIPQVEQMFREQYNISSDQPTIFAALINPDIQDKLLKGDLDTITIGAEARAAGFSRSFSRFESLRKAGMTQDKARQVYQQAGTYQSMAARTDRQFDLGTVESAGIGDVEAAKELGLIAAETASMSSVQAGAKKKDGKVTGLLEG